MHGLQREMAKVRRRVESIADAARERVVSRAAQPSAGARIDIASRTNVIRRVNVGGTGEAGLASAHQQAPISQHSGRRRHDPAPDNQQDRELRRDGSSKTTAGDQPR